MQKVFAVSFEPITGSGGLQTGATPATTLEKFFTIALGFLTTVGGIMFLIFFVLGALNWITSGGDREKISRAQHYMSNAVIGLILVILAWAFTGVVGLALGFNILDLVTSLSAIKIGP